MKKLVLVIVLLSLSSCFHDNFETGKKQLENMGYTDVEKTESPFFENCCGEQDWNRSHFTCKAKDGSKVNGCFCSSTTKGVTIRFE